MKKIFIATKPDINSNCYYNIMWRIPFNDFSNIDWICIDQSIFNYDKSFIKQIPNIDSSDCIFFWNCNTLIKTFIKEILSLHCKKLFYIDDIHQTGYSTVQYRQKIFENFDIIFSTYAYTFNKFYPTIQAYKIKWLPHNVTTEFNVELNMNPINKVLLSGAIDANVYPMRHKLYSYYKTHPNLIDHLSFMGYSVKKHDIVGYDYIKFLNKYIACFTCCLNKNTPYIVAKFFEISASGALLIAYDEYVKNELKQLGFIDGYNYISVDSDNLLQKIKWVTDINNKNDIDRIRINGYNLVKSQHCLINRVKYVDTIITNNLDLIIHNEMETIEQLKQGYSFSCYNFNEFNLCIDNANDELKNYLKSILNHNAHMDKVLVGIPPIILETQKQNITNHAALLQWDQYIYNNRNSVLQLLNI